MEGELGYDERVRIANQVILGTPAPANESPEAAAWRQQMTKDNEAAKAAGHMLELPFDWEDNTPYNQRAANPAGAFSKDQQKAGN